MDPTFKEWYNQTVRFNYHRSPEGCPASRITVRRELIAYDIRLHVAPAIYGIIYIRIFEGKKMVVTEAFLQSYDHNFTTNLNGFTNRLEKHCVS